MVWDLGKLADADAWWVNGSRSQLLTDGSLRVSPGAPAGRSLQLNLAEVDRPIAFAEPIASKDFQPALRFDMESVRSMNAVLARFEAGLRPLAAQFCLASHVIENESAMAAGVYHVNANGALLAVVNLQGQVGVLPTARPVDFAGALWHHRPASADSIPETFVRASLSQLMWQYALRTSRDVLPKRYRKGLLYFRRPPRLPQRLLKDAHLLLIRELACAAGSFEELQQRTGLAAGPLARHLGALYLVGAITANPKRAATGWPVARRGSDASDSSVSLPSSLPPSGIEQDPSVGGHMQARARFDDLTAPAPMGME